MRGDFGNTALLDGRCLSRLCVSKYVVGVVRAVRMRGIICIILFLSWIHNITNRNFLTLQPYVTRFECTHIYQQPRIDSDITYNYRVSCSLGGVEVGRII